MHPRVPVSFIIWIWAFGKERFLPWMDANGDSLRVRASSSARALGDARGFAGGSDGVRKPIFLWKWRSDTGDGAAARKFAREIQCGMVGVNVGVPAPMAVFSFCGWNQSFFGDLHVQGLEGIQFYTRAKVVLTRWNPGGKRTTWS